jgi:hypothetical protein
MSRLTRISALALLLSAAGCAALRTAPPEQNAELRLAQGSAAFDAGRYNDAFDQLAWVYTHCAGREAGFEAALAMAALELDPRHPTGRPEVGMQLLAELILDPTTPDPVRAVTRTTYLLGLGLGARPAASPVSPPGEGAVPPAEAVAPAEAVSPEEAVRPADEETPPPAGLPAQPVADGFRRAPIGAEPVFGCGRVLREAGPAPASLPTLPGPSLAAMLAESEADRAAQAAQAATMLEELNRLRRELTETRAELERIRRTLRP